MLVEARTADVDNKASQRWRFQKPVKIPQDYDTSHSLLDYLKHFECAVVNGWDDEERAEFLATGLGNDAQKVLSGLSSDDCLLYPKFVERLELLFGAEKQLHLHQARLQSRRKQPKESLQGLARDIRSMVDLVYPRIHWSDGVDVSHSPLIPHQDLLSTSRWTRGRRSPQADPTQSSGSSAVRPKATKSTPSKRIVCS